MTETTPVSWASLNLNEVVTDRPEGGSGGDRSELPEGNYTFKLVGAKDNPYKSGTTDIDFVVVSGPRSKQHIFATIPPPSATKFAIQFAAILVKRLGIPQQDGEELIDYLNRAASSGASTLSGDIIHDTYFSTKYNENRVKTKLLWFSLQSVA